MQGVIESFKYLRFKEAGRLLDVQEAPSDALHHLVWKHNTLVCRAEVTTLDGVSERTLVHEFYTLFDLLRDATVKSGTLALACAILHNESKCIQIGLQDLTRHYGVLLEKASILLNVSCASSTTSVVEDVGDLIKSFRQIGKRLKMQDPAAFELLVLASCSLAERLLIENDVVNSFQLLSYISALGLPEVAKDQEQERDWLRVAQYRDHASLRSLCSVLRAVSGYISTGASPDVRRCLAEVRCQALDPFVTYFQALVCFESTADAGADIWKALQQLPASSSNSVRSALLNLVGCHLAKKGKWHSSVEHFLASLEQDPCNLLALWNMAQCYDCLGMHDAQFQALVLLFEEALQTRVSGRSIVLDGPDGRRCFLSEVAPAPSLSLAYHSARRLMSLERYEKAADCYDRLLKLWEDCTVAKEIHAFDDRLPVPDCRDVQLERVHCLLNCGRFEDCVQLCGQLLGAASVEETSTDCPSAFPDDGDGVVFGRLSSTEPSSSASHAVKLQLRTIAFHFYRGSSLASLERYEDALEDIRCALRMTHALKQCQCGRSRPVASGRDASTGESAETPAKRPKLDGNADNVVEGEVGVVDPNSTAASNSGPSDACDVCHLKSKLLVNLGVIRVRQDLLRDAYNHLQAAIVTWPGNIDAAYNLSVLLIATGKLEAARIVWQQFKEGARRNGAELNGALVHSSSVGAAQEQYLDEKLASNS